MKHNSELCEMSQCVEYDALQCGWRGEGRYAIHEYWYSADDECWKHRVLVEHYHKSVQDLASAMYLFEGKQRIMQRTNAGKSYHIMATKVNGS